MNATNIAEDYETYLQFIEIMSPVLIEEDGKKKIFTPELVKIVDGEFADHYVGSDLNRLIEILKGEIE